MTLTSIPLEDLRVDDVFYLHRYGATSGPGRRVVTVNPMTYVRADLPNSTPHSREQLAGTRAVYVERDDETAPEDETTPEAAPPEQDERIAAWESIAAHPAFVDQYNEPGPLADAFTARLDHLLIQDRIATSASMETSPATEGYDHATRPRFAREDALVLAVQAVGGTEHVMDVVSLAEQIERYVNGNTTEDGPRVPDEDPLIADAHPIQRGVLQPAVIEFPRLIETAEDAALDWPEGTQVTDRDGDPWTRGDDSTYDESARDGWVWKDYRESGSVSLSGYLPATVTRFGGAS